MGAEEAETPGPRVESTTSITENVHIPPSAGSQPWAPKV